MSTIDILYLFLIAVLALGIATYQYLYKAKRNDNKKFLFAFLRFSIFFILGLILFNPTFKQEKIVNIKPNLVVAIDNSNSVSISKQHENVSQFINKLKSSGLSEKFKIDYYTYGEDVAQKTDSILFNEKQTNISKVFSTLKEVYTQSQAPTILLSDGNQTLGQDYVISSLNYKHPIYPVVLGDSILKTDLNIANIQHNKYAFLKNEFPVEVTLKYIGKGAIHKSFQVKSGSSVVFSKSLTFSNDNNTQVVHFTLPAVQIGKLNYTATIAEITNEENKVNNIRDFSVEVIDERTNVLVISDIIHPDIGALKKAIETNEQRKVTIVKPNDSVDLNKYQAVILYQPNLTFKNVFNQIRVFKKNYLVVTGLQTDWTYLNSITTNYKNTVINQPQEYLSRYNPEFDLFQTDELRFESFPPLIGLYGGIQMKDFSKIYLFQTINSIETETPILSFYENNSRREALLLGEGIWKWRAQSFLNNQNFEKFDAFVGKTIQYLASNTKKERLVIDVKEVFLLGDTKINAQYFDKNYELDANETITSKLINIKTNKEYNYNFLYKNNGYELNLSHLPPGKYTYKINVENKGLIKKGVFEIIDFNIEAQFINPDVTKLSQLATNSKNRLTYIADYSKLFSELKTNNNYKTIQKSTTNEMHLIDWKYLLVVLIILLTFEWLLRKYNGLI